MSNDNIRFFETQVIQHKNELIPCWKLKSKIEKDTYSDDDVNALYYGKEEINSNQDPIFAIWDTLKDKVHNIEEIHLYPKEIEYAIGDDVLYEKSYKKLQFETIKEVSYKEDEISYFKKDKVKEMGYLRSYKTDKLEKDLDMKIVYKLIRYRTIYTFHSGNSCQEYSISKFNNNKIIDNRIK